MTAGPNVLSLLPADEIPTEAAIEKAARTAAYRANLDFIHRDLIPRMIEQEVLFRLKSAQAAEDLWVARGMYLMLDRIGDHIKKGARG